MLKVAVLDDYQNVFSQIINVKEHETDYNFTVFNEKFEMYHFIGASFILSGIYLSNRRVNA